MIDFLFVHPFENRISSADPASSVEPSKQNLILAYDWFFVLHPFENGNSSADPVSSVRPSMQTSY